MTTYPKALWRPLTEHSAPGTLEQRDLLVIHVTQGHTAAGAIETFRTSKAPHRVSAHFVIDQDGAVLQLLPIEDTAWHASEVNSRSVGIEHVAVVGNMPVSDSQYRASAELCAWLCRKLKIPCDREHIQGHHECSPKDGHTLCPSGAMDVDRLVMQAMALRGFE